MPRHTSIRTGHLGLLVLLAVACREDPAGPAGEPAPGSDNRDWSVASHGNKTLPNYGVVFPQDAVNTIEIRMTAAQWTAIREDMRRLWGFDFGGGGGIGPPPGGFPSIEPTYQAVDFRFNGKSWKNVGFRLKGNSTLSAAWRQGNFKLPFRLQFDEFEDSLPTVKNQRFHGFKELSMSTGFSDLSLVREKVMADLVRAGGVPAAHTAFYRVLIDFGAGLKYCGLYTMVEVIDDTMVKNQFGEDEGNIYKPESNFVTFNAAQFEKKNNKTTPSWSDVQAFLAALHAPTRLTTPALWRASFEATFNVDHYLKWLAINNALVSWDTYGAIAHNYYLYNHSRNKLTWIPWDHNNSLSGSPGITGGGTPGPGGRLGLSLSMNEVSANWPLLRAVRDDSVYFARYRSYMKAFSTSTLTAAVADAMVERAHTLITPHVTGPNGEQPGHTYTSPAGFAAALPTLRTHLSQRRALVASWIP